MTLIVVPGEPVPWQRARRAGRVHFTDPRVVAQKNRIALAARAAHVDLAPRGSAVILGLSFVFMRPARSKNKDHVVKPDVDNLVKLTMDALTGIAWDDDTQVVSVHAHKMYGLEAFTQIEVNRW